MSCDMLTCQNDMRIAAHAKSLTLHFGVGQIRENVRHASLEFQCLETPEGKAVRRPGPEVVHWESAP